VHITVHTVVQNSMEQFWLYSSDPSADHKNYRIFYRTLEAVFSTFVRYYCILSL